MPKSSLWGGREEKEGEKEEKEVRPEVNRILPSQPPDRDPSVIWNTRFHCGKCVSFYTLTDRVKLDYKAPPLW